jgi:hypothetical protein
MLFLVGGLAPSHWDRALKRSSEIFAGDQAIGKPISGRSLAGALTPSYADQLIELLSDHLRQKPQALADGVGLLFAAAPGADTAAFAARFFPFLLARHFVAADVVGITDVESARQFNDFRAGMAASATILRRAVAATQNEMVQRRNRTPLLLPLSNFHSGHLVATLQDLFDSLPGAENPTRAISQASVRFQRWHPIVSSHGEQSYFQDTRDVAFKSPGRNLHGNIAAQPPTGHDNTCYLRGSLRLSGQIVSGFHYDCSKGKPTLEGKFPDCHGEKLQRTGKPHLNIFPNDAFV